MVLHRGRRESDFMNLRFSFAAGAGAVDAFLLYGFRVILPLFFVETLFLGAALPVLARRVLLADFLLVVLAAAFFPAPERVTMVNRFLGIF